MSFTEHDFYCIKCGNRGIPLSRKTGFQRERFHRKKLFCLHCQEEVNHIECKNYEDVIEFKEKFERGEYQNEAEASISYVRNSGFGKIDMGKKSNRKNKVQMRACI